MDVTPVNLVMLLSAIGIVLLIGELLLPTHGVLGITGLVMLGSVIVVCFYINRWLGLGVFAAAVLLGPVVGAVFLKIWPYTPIGRRVLLPPVHSRVTVPPVAVGQGGRTVTELRPMGEVTFDGGRLRIEATSEHGMIAAGREVRVVAFVNGKPAVRAMEMGRA
jgi:membrane-bound ClpP family serine protease